MVTCPFFGNKTNGGFFVFLPDPTVFLVALDGLSGSWKRWGLFFVSSQYVCFVVSGYILSVRFQLSLAHVFFSLPATTARQGREMPHVWSV